METKTDPEPAPAGYDPSRFPPFAVTVDVVILTMSEGMLHVLLVRRGEAPFQGMWAIPGGFKRPTETLDEAAKRELAEETGVDAASLLTQFGAYGDPARDPRMNVVTVGYLAVLRDVGGDRGGHGRGRRCPGPGRRRAQRERSTWPSTTSGSCAMRSSASGSSSRSRASPRRSSARRSRWPSCGPCTRPSGASSSTPPTSGGPSSPTPAGSSRPAAGPVPARPGAARGALPGRPGVAATAGRSIACRRRTGARGAKP